MVLELQQRPSRFPSARATSVAGDDGHRGVGDDLEALRLHPRAPSEGTGEVLDFVVVVCLCVCVCVCVCVGEKWIKDVRQRDKVKIQPTLRLISSHHIRIPPVATIL